MKCSIIYVSGGTTKSVGKGKPVLSATTPITLITFNNEISG